jgi:hypothetical protein
MLTLKDIVDFMDPNEHSSFLEIFKVRFRECCQMFCLNENCTEDCDCVCDEDCQLSTETV